MLFTALIVSLGYLWCNRILRVTLFFGKSVHNEPFKKIYMFFFDYWTVFSTKIQFNHELAPRSLWLFSQPKQLNLVPMSSRLTIHQAVCALRSLSIMGGIQNLIICLKMAWSEQSWVTAEWIFVNYAVDIYDFALNVLRKPLKKKVCPILWEKTVSFRW